MKIDNLYTVVDGDGSQLEMWKAGHIKMIEGGVAFTASDNYSDGAITVYLSYEELCWLVTAIYNQEIFEGVEVNE